MFCTGNPRALVNTVWLNNTLHFGLRGVHEHVQMMWGDIELKLNAAGVEFLEFNERVSKTRQGSARIVRAFAPKMFATGNSLHFSQPYLITQILWVHYFVMQIWTTSQTVL